LSEPQYEKNPEDLVFLKKEDQPKLQQAPLTVEQLLAMREEIDKKLPARSLKDMNLEEELVIQFIKVKTLQESVLTDPDVPANQRAQVSSAVANTLQHLVKMQTEFHTAERFKTIENLLIKHMKTWPRDLAEKFIQEYEALV
jgi:hypothetical protein